MSFQLMSFFLCHVPRIHASIEVFCFRHEIGLERGLRMGMSTLHIMKGHYKLDLVASSLAILSMAFWQAGLRCVSFDQVKNEDTRFKEGSLRESECG